VGFIDFESHEILPRPQFPPEPCGVAIKWPGKKSKYYAWAHLTDNNCSFDEAVRALKEIWYSGLPLGFHNAPFDVSVAVEKLGLKMLEWDMINDTMILLFLDNPYSQSLALKPSANAYLGMPPFEQEAVHDWLRAHRKELGIRGENMGKYIWMAPGKLVTPYACGDTDRTSKLFHLLYQRVCDRGMKKAYDTEREVMPILLRNERDGIRADQKGLDRDVTAYEEVLIRTDEWIRKRLKTPDLNIDSGGQLAQALARAGVVEEFVMTAPSKNFPNGQPSTSKENLTLDLFQDTKVYRALTYRSKLAYSLSTFMRPWLHTANATGGTIHTHWNQVKKEGAGAITGRLSSSPNFQNTTKNVKEDLEKAEGYHHPKFLKFALELPSLRKYILPDRGQIIGVRDVSQEELRILAHYEDAELCALYNSKNPPKEWLDKEGNVDVHLMVQHLLANAGRELDRYDTKRMNFGILYGMGAKGLATRLGIDKPKAKDLINTWNEVMPGVSDLVDDLKALVHDGGEIMTWGGRLYGMPPPFFDGHEMRNRDYVCLNYLIQGSGGDVLKRVIIEFDKRRRESRMLLTVHDELGFSTNKAAMQQEQKILAGIIQDLAFDVPMRSDGKYGPNFGTMTPWKD
jgi:DNA polymerase-1